MTADFTAVEAVRMTQLTYCLKDARTIRNAMKVMGERRKILRNQECMMMQMKISMEEVTMDLSKWMQTKSKVK